jgi:hypothetical protein
MQPQWKGHLEALEKYLTSLEKFNQPLAEKSFTPCWKNCLAPLALLEK